jgi:hypothetical protein
MLARIVASSNSHGELGDLDSRTQLSIAPSWNAARYTCTKRDLQVIESTVRIDGRSVLNPNAKAMQAKLEEFMGYVTANLTAISNYRTATGSSAVDPKGCPPFAASRSTRNGPLSCR